MYIYIYICVYMPPLSASSPALELLGAGDKHPSIATAVTGSTILTSEVLALALALTAATRAASRIHSSTSCAASSRSWLCSSCPSDWSSSTFSGRAIWQRYAIRQRRRGWIPRWAARRTVPETVCSETMIVPVYKLSSTRAKVSGSRKSKVREILSFCMTLSAAGRWAAKVFLKKSLPAASTSLCASNCLPPATIVTSHMRPWENRPFIPISTALQCPAKVTPRFYKECKKHAGATHSARTMCCSAESCVRIVQCFITRTRRRSRKQTLCARKTYKIKVP